MEDINMLFAIEVLKELRTTFCCADVWSTAELTDCNKCLFKISDLQSCKLWSELYG